MTESAACHRGSSLRSDDEQQRTKVLVCTDPRSCQKFLVLTGMSVIETAEKEKLHLLVLFHSRSDFGPSAREHDDHHHQ
jgi:hypothetical protein